MDITQHKHSTLEKSWEEIAFDLTEYSSSFIQSFLQSFNQDFIKGLPRVDKNFIPNILNNLP